MWLSTLTSTELRYASVEREALALAWACERFKEYVIGIPIILETDYKPLLQMLETKNLDDLSPRLQRFRIRLMRYDFTVLWTEGNKMFVAGALKITHNMIFEISYHVTNIFCRILNAR